MVEKHPLVATIVGFFSGWSGWFFEHLPQATQFVSFIGAMAGTATAVMGFIVLAKNNSRK